LAAAYSYHSGHITPIGLYDLIAENRDRTIVLDDVTSIFNQPTALQIFLAALGVSPGGSRARVVRYKTAQQDRSVSFTGGIIAISNLPLDGHHHGILAAIRDRVNVLNYEPTDEQILALVTRLADGGVAGIPPVECRTVVHFLEQECQKREIRP